MIHEKHCIWLDEPAPCAMCLALRAAVEEATEELQRQLRSEKESSDIAHHRASLLEDDLSQQKQRLVALRAKLVEAEKERDEAQRANRRCNAHPDLMVRYCTNCLLEVVRKTAGDIRERNEHEAGVK
jgi:chromosome segregation ATPase